MNEAEIKHEIRLLAIEQMLGNLYVTIYRAFRVSDAEMKEAHEGLLETMRTDTIPSADPALSDLAAAELHDAVERLISMIEQMRKAAA
jgi:hypothetical protein